MIEFWILLGNTESELDEISKYKSLTEIEKAQCMSVHKSPPNYVEGMILSRNIKGLFRNVPPRIALTLGMTEKHEKVMRQKLMQKHNIDEVDAAILMAKKMLA